MNTTMRMAVLTLFTAVVFSAPASAARSHAAGITPTICDEADTPMAMSEVQRRELLVELAHHALQTSRIVGAPSAVQSITIGNTTAGNCRSGVPAPLSDASSGV